MTSTLSATATPLPAAAAATEHLIPERWETANRHLIRKALAEFSHERILHPEPVSTPETDEPAYRLVSDDGCAEYRFTARRLPLNHWSVPAAGIRRFTGARGPAPAVETALDALVFITEFSATLGINDQMLPLYLEEISSTLSSHAFKNRPGAPSSALLA